MMFRTVQILFFLFVFLLFASCRRELDKNEDFRYNEPALVLGDNSFLFSKIFRFTDGDALLWFDIRNEIANFSHPFLSLRYNENGLDYNRRIDLRGYLYEYDDEAKELNVLNYPLYFSFSDSISARLLFSFARKQENGCEAIPDPDKRNQCERTFKLTLKSIEIPDLDLTIPVETKINTGRDTLYLSGLSQEVYLIN